MNRMFSDHCWDSTEQWENEGPRGWIQSQFRQIRMKVIRLLSLPKSKHAHSRVGRIDGSSSTLQGGILIRHGSIPRSRDHRSAIIHVSHVSVVLNVFLCGPGCPVIRGIVSESRVIGDAARSYRSLSVEKPCLLYFSYNHYLSLWLSSFSSLFNTWLLFEWESNRIEKSWFANWNEKLLQIWADSNVYCNRSNRASWSILITLTTHGLVYEL
jgi:hypothetical protein